MKAISLVCGSTEVALIEYPEPTIDHPDDVKLRVLEVGVCGTDRELIAESRALPPQGEKRLIIGHEMLGEVVEVGSGVHSFKKGDLAVVTVRRGCGSCPACLNDRADMCYRSEYTERGIKERHGFQCEYVVDRQHFLIPVPLSIRDCAVLCEPMSVVQKAIEEILSIQSSRLPDWTAAECKNKRALIAGLGPIGLLAAMALKLRGFQVIGMDIVHPDTPRPGILRSIGGEYAYGKETAIQDIPSRYGQIDLILEATGHAELSLNILSALGTNGAAVFTGVALKHISVTFGGGALIHHLVLRNQVMLGSVNAGKKHWAQGLQDLEKIHQLWGTILEQLITKRISYTNYQQALQPPTASDIKTVVVW